VPPEKTVDSIAVLLSDIDQISRNGFTSEEIRNSKTHLAGEIILDAEDTENRMKRLARQFFYDERILSIEESISILETIDPVTVNAMIIDSLSQSSRSLIAYARKKEVKEARKKWK
jgi:predicted Zn-dependent peptidase